MKPAPSTPSRRTGRGSPSAGFLHALSAWNSQTSDLAGRLTTRGPKYSDSPSWPAFLRRVSPVSTHSRIATGAG